MPDSTASLNYADFKARIGRHLGFTDDPTNWTQAVGAGTTEDLIEEVVDKGVNKFYAPPILEGQPPYIWSFLILTDSVTIVGTESVASVPSDFAGIIGNLSKVSGPGENVVQILPRDRFRAVVASGETSTVAPAYGMVRPKSSDGSDSQEWEIVVHPVPVSEAVYEIKYRHVPPKLTDANPWPLGGGLHSETIMQSCLAEAELVEDHERGPQYAAYLELLGQSILADKSMNLATATDNWPLTDRPTGLQLSYNDYMREASILLGYGGDVGALSYEQAEEVDFLVNEAYRLFLTPQAAVGENFRYWNFMTPEYELQLTQGQYAYPLPADFGGVVEQEITYKIVV